MQHAPGGLFDERGRWERHWDDTCGDERYWDDGHRIQDDWFQGRTTKDYCDQGPRDGGDWRCMGSGR